MQNLRNFLLTKINLLDQPEGVPIYHLIDKVKEKELDNNDEVIKDVFNKIYELASLGLIEIKILPEEEGDESYVKITEIGKIRLERQEG
ncbi:MAG: hypothetical protein ACTSQY_05830 [Candidatus Odinarchaeia archaeon]